MKNPMFRVWNKKTKVWQEKDFHLIGEVMLLQGFPIAQLEDLEINQYTGLKDKNGKEIYEGDILQFRKKTQIGEVIHNWIVIWDEEHARFRTKMGEETNSVFEQVVRCGNHFVVGNIYENPELGGGNE